MLNAEEKAFTVQVLRADYAKAIEARNQAEYVYDMALRDSKPGDEITPERVSLLNAQAALETARQALRKALGLTH